MNRWIRGLFWYCKRSRTCDADVMGMSEGKDWLVDPPPIIEHPISSTSSSSTSRPSSMWVATLKTRWSLMQKPGKTNLYWDFIFANLALQWQLGFRLHFISPLPRWYRRMTFAGRSWWSWARRPTSCCSRTDGRPGSCCRHGLSESAKICGVLTNTNISRYILI